MKRLFRQSVGFLFVGPVALMVYLFSIFIGNEKAIRLWGPSLTYIARLFLKFFVPKINTLSEFDLFSVEMKRNFWIWRPFYDFSIVEESPYVFKLLVENCPFCETIIKLGLPSLAPYVCQGDWVVAKENADKWDFQREHQIGTGDTFCDHTYLRKKERSAHVS